MTHAMGMIRMSSFRTSRRSSSGVCAGTTGARSSTLSAFSSSTDVYCFSSRDIARCGGQEEMSGGLTGSTVAFAALRVYAIWACDWRPTLPVLLLALVTPACNIVSLRLPQSADNNKRSIVVYGCQGTSYSCSSAICRMRCQIHDRPYAL